MHLRLVDDDLAGGISELINDPARADAMAAAAREVALQYDWGTLGDRFAAIVAGVLTADGR